MLLSMTGHGDAHDNMDGVAVAIEVRTINNRYFKLTVRADDRYAALESQIEDVVRRYVRRGTVQVELRIDREPSPEDYRLNEMVLASYRQQLWSLNERLGIHQEVELQAILALPGVVDERAAKRVNLDAEWSLVERTLITAIQKLGQMRADEGRVMAGDLLLNRNAITTEVVEIERLAPQVSDQFRSRLLERLNKVLLEHNVQVQPADVVREVALLADRADISEEIVRLRCHLHQFDDFIASPESSGRKLEFLTQEMFRETNTIGSKANDALIARHVIEIKTAIERIREMIQNVE